MRKVHPIEIILWDTVGLLAYLTLVVGLMLTGYILPSLSMYLVAAFAVIRAFARATGGLGNCIYGAVQGILYGVPVVIVLLKGGFSQALLILMRAFAGGFEGIMVGILNLVGQGHISVFFAFFAIIVLFALSKLGLEIGSALAYRIIFRWIAPFFSLAVLATVWGRGDPRQTVLIVSSVLALLLAVEAIYLISRGVFSAFRQ